MATTVTLAQIRTAWDNAVTAYDLLRGSFGANQIMNSALDLRSTASGGAFDISNVAIANYTPNSGMEIIMTDGTYEFVFTYDDMLLPETFDRKLDYQLGIIFKYWRLVDKIEQTLTNAGFTVTYPAAATPTDTDYKAVIDDIVQGYEYQGLTSTVTQHP